MRTLFYGNCNLMALFAIAANAKREPRDPTDHNHISFMLNFYFAMPDPLVVYDDANEVQRDAFRRCDVLYIQCTRETTLGPKSSEAIIRELVPPHTRVVFIPWYQQQWFSTEPHTFEETMDAMRRKDAMAAAKAAARRNSFAPRMAPFFRENCRKTRMFHDDTHPTYFFLAEMYRQSCEWLGGAAVALPTAKEMYTNPAAGYFVNIFALGLSKPLRESCVVQCDLQYSGAPRTCEELFAETEISGVGGFVAAGELYSV